MIKVITVLVNPVYVPQCGSDGSQKGNFIVRSKFGKREAVIIARDFNGHAGGYIEDFEDQHRCCGFGVRNQEGNIIS